MSTALEELPAETGLERHRNVILYSVTDKTIESLRADCLPLKIEGIEDQAGAALVHAGRMKCVKARSAIESARKQMKAESLEYGRKVDQEAKRLTDMIAPIEKRLCDEEAKIAAEVARLAKDKAEASYKLRLVALAEVGGTMPEAVCRSLGDEEFAITLADIARKVKEQKEQAERDRAAEVERKRLAAIDVERLKAEKEKLAAERAEIEKTRREQQEQQQKLDAERHRQEEEEAARQRKEHEKKAAEERQQREAAIMAGIEKANAEARERAERLKPDRDKLANVAFLIESIPMPDISPEAEGAAAKIQEVLLLAASSIRRLAASA